jgi:alpha-tubulin suppressor-like RCC1 family protein
VHRPSLALLCVALAACGSSDSSTEPHPTGAGLHANVFLDSVSAVDAPTKRPAVIVLDASNKGVAGVQVTFRITKGGGTLSDSVLTTDASGVATLGAWTLGPTATMNILEARASNFEVVRFTVRGTWQHRLATTATGGCAIAGTKTYCWGDNTHLEFGFQGAPVQSPTPVLTPFNLAEIYGGYASHVCGAVAAQLATCWGRGTFGQLGRGTVDAEANIAGPGVASALGDKWVSITTGRLTTCGILTTGTGYCWGSNQQGEIGNPIVPIAITTKVVLPQEIGGGLTFSAIAPGWQHTCGIVTSGETYCWGYNGDGELGIAATDSRRASPAKVATDQRFVSLTSGGKFTCGLTAEGNAYCWGANSNGMLGDGTTLDRSAPVAVAGGLRFTALSAGTYFLIPQASSTAIVDAGRSGHVCGLTESGKAYCWGYNGYGQLGDGTTTDRLTPTAVAGGLTFSALSLGEGTSCGMRGTKVWCWGANMLAQIGDGTTTNRREPTPVLLP